MGNVLDFRTYRAPSLSEYGTPTAEETLLIEQFDWNSIPVNERQAICYARGAALHVMSWIRSCCVVKSPDNNIVDDLPSSFFVQIANSLLNYKIRATNCTLEGVPHCTVKLLRNQINNVVKCDSHLQAMWRKRDKLPSDSLDLANKAQYIVEWQMGWETKWRSLETGVWLSLRQCFN